MWTATAWDLNIVAGDSFFSKMVPGLFFRQRLCHILSDVTLDVMQGDVQVEAENVETKSVYLLLNLDGTLPLTGTRSNSF